MTVFLQPRGKAYSYDFWFRKHRYTGSTKCTGEAEAKRFEDALKRELRFEWAGLVPHRFLKVDDEQIEIADGVPRVMMDEDARIRRAGVGRILAACASDDCSGWIYIIGNPEGGAVKIGYSATPDERLRNLQTASPDRLEVLALMPGGMKTEERLHAWLANYRKAGEWFERTGEVVMLMESLTAVAVDSP